MNNLNEYKKLEKKLLNYLNVSYGYSGCFKAQLWEDDLNSNIKQDIKQIAKIAKILWEDGERERYAIMLWHDIQEDIEKLDKLERKIYEKKVRLLNDIGARVLVLKMFREQEKNTQN